MGRRLVWLLPALLPWFSLPGFSQAQVQLTCGGALVEARGSAELKRPTQRLRFFLALEAEETSSDAVLASLQRRLADVRRRLQALRVSDLQVTSPSTWKRPPSRGVPEVVQASLQVSGQLAPAQLQPLLREVGGLPGVRLSPVAPEADGADGPAVRRQLLRVAYQDALQQAQDVAAAMGLRVVQPLEVQLEGDVRPVPLRGVAMADGVVPPFDPAELPAPIERLSLQVRFCAL
jgi:uncharacterized protein YggE